MILRRTRRPRTTGKSDPDWSAPVAHGERQVVGPVLRSTEQRRDIAHAWM